MVESVKIQLQHTKGNHQPFPNRSWDSSRQQASHPFHPRQVVGNLGLTVGPSGIPGRIVVVAALSIVIMMFADIFEVATFGPNKLFLQTSQFPLFPFKKY